MNSNRGGKRDGAGDHLGTATKAIPGTDAGPLPGTAAVNTTPGEILLCAATRWEARPAARALGLRPVSDREWTGAAAGRPVRLLRTGMGSARALAALRKTRSDRPAPSLVVSTGFAGGLQPALRTGDLVGDFRGLPLDLLQAAQETAARQGRTLRFGRFAHADAPIGDPALKRALASRTRACAVDMETEPLRAWAQERSSGFLALRVILDGLDQRLPDAPPSQEAGAADLARWAAGRWREWPLLAVLGTRQALAARSLAAFLGEFLLRPELTPVLKGEDGPP